MECWSLTFSRKKAMKVGAKVDTNIHYAAFQMAAVARQCDLFALILDMIGDLRPRESASR
jgi:hypothetical protein